ncbi:MAG: hypothetical protein FWH42_00065 [Dehalococcoidia bacterium]|nr:hypothetical protein [Dehalococcoidia bacterium]
MQETNQREVISLLRNIDKRLEAINYALADIKRELPKTPPYYGDLLKEIVRAIESQR